MNADVLQETMRIEERIEYDIEPQLHAAITKLREESFPEDHKPRSYYQQLPHFRFLAYEDETLVGHMGVDHRVVSVGESVFSTFGVIDLCVREKYQGRGVGSALLGRILQLAKDKGIDFVILVSDIDRFYEKHGFIVITPEFRWLRIYDHKTVGIGNMRLDVPMMVKQIGKNPWPDKPVDLLGYLF